MRKEINVKRNEEREGGKKRRQKVKGDGGKENVYLMIMLSLLIN